MRMYDLITKKKHGEALTDAEITYMIDGYVKGDIPDYQMSAMLMAIWFKGMTDHEITELTKVMAKSGDMIDLSAIAGKKVDKHSTGGVGDKTTLICAPIVAACGGELAGRRTVALITDMDTPLGYGIGNSIEVMESMDVLKGEGPADLREVSLQLASNMLYLVGKGTPEECRTMAEKSIADGSAFETFCTMVRAQGGDDSVLRDYTKFPQAPYRAEIKAERSGCITKMNAEEIGETSVVLGAGRETKESTIDFSAGLILHKKYGDEVKEGDSLVTLYTSKESALADAEKMYREAIAIGDEQPVKEPLVYARVEKDKVEKY